MRRRKGGKIWVSFFKKWGGNFFAGAATSNEHTGSLTKMRGATTAWLRGGVKEWRPQGAPSTVPLIDSWSFDWLLVGWP